MKSNSGLSRLQKNTGSKKVEMAQHGRLNEASSSEGRQEPLPAVLLLQLLAGHPDHHAVGKGRLEAVPRELANHFTDSQAVILTYMV